MIELVMRLDMVIIMIMITNITTTVIKATGDTGVLTDTIVNLDLRDNPANIGSGSSGHPPQHSSNDADRVVFPDFNNQVPTTRAPQPTRPVTTSTTTVRPTTTDRSLLDLVICIRACPTTSEYNPVCGTNNVTYNNPGALQCARNCGINVGVARQAPCPRAVPQIPQPTSTARPITNPTTRATVSGQTTRATPVTRPTTMRPTAAPTVNPTRFTNIDVNRPSPTLIPLDILQSVFGTAAPTTNNNEELDFDIDKRIN
ncbi:mucin-2-like [Cydia amplana]|uniref:mucin-2-like n=1 Tax=Cydia amplana TaxID=1869771 RepID=UPI002FE63333